MKIIQRADAFRFGTDAVLLSDFLLLKRGARCVDLGAGTGVIAVLACAHHPDIHMEAVEIQRDMADMAQRSVDMNGLGDRIRVHEMDMRSAPKALGFGAFDAVACNPPYFRAGTAIVSENENKRVSKHEGDITLDEICGCAFSLLKTGGRFSVVFPAQSMLSLFFAMRNRRLAPKRVRCVHATPQHAPRLALVDAVKDGGDQLHWLPPLILKNEDGTPTREWLRIYGPSSHA